jgi:hypothetical protein
MRSTLSVLTLTAMLLLSSGEADACTCLEATPSELIAEADLIFEGRAVRTEMATSRLDRLSRWLAPSYYSDLGITLFQTTRTYKGSIRNYNEIRHYRIESMCGCSFEKGRDYLIVAYRTGSDVYATNLCLLNGDPMALRDALEAE